MKLLLIVLIGVCCFLNLDAKATWKPDTRIVNGYKGTAERFPYQVALEIEADAEGKTVNKCGGSIIDIKIIITAAHCFDGFFKGEASFGSNKYMKGIIRKFSRVTIHEKYDSKTYANDIAIVHLDSSITPNGKTISFISLDYGSVTSKQNITISGFGLISDKEDTEQLFYAEEKVITQSECAETYELPSHVFCTLGYNAQQTCSGDSGGPAVKYDKNGKPWQIGVLSFGATSCEEGDPDVFTKIADFKSWIAKHFN